MSLVFSELTAADWGEFEQHSPAACAWLHARALEREYARLRALKKLTTWQARRLEELRRLEVPDPPASRSKVGWIGTSGTEMEDHDY